MIIGMFARHAKAHWPVLWRSSFLTNLPHTVGYFHITAKTIFFFFFSISEPGNSVSVQGILKLNSEGAGFI